MTEELIETNGETEAEANTETHDRAAQPVRNEEPPRLSFSVVGIGASAGGLEAAIEFFKAVPADSGLAFVFIQHLPPDRESLVADIIDKQTEMSVQQVEDGTAVEPNHVYVIRPGHTLTIRNGRFKLGKSLRVPGHNRPVDDFFRSLAEEQRERSIGVVLSGMGSNGTAGAEVIKAVGGLVVAQDPETAKFASMPRHVIDSGVADLILRPNAMPEALMRYTTHPYVNGRQTYNPALPRDFEQFGEIIAILKSRTRLDFSGYKKPTVFRRIQRRMGLHQLEQLGDYSQMLRQNSMEVTALADDLMIHVTGFFRDPEAWEVMRDKVVAPLIAERDADTTIRCWVAACSSGEEAYTLAMILAEAMESANKYFDLKIFATDTADRTLTQARNGLYPLGIESEISPERLARFFDREDAVYRVKKEIRELVVFAPQNIVQDPPFSRIDIATCRNLLIYLEPELQKRVLSLLHFGLRDGGALFLGSSETTAGSEELFEPVDKRFRIFRRIGPTRHGFVEFPFAAHSAGVSEREGLVSRGLVRATIPQIAHRILLDQYTPAAVVVDRQFNVAYFHGHTSEMLVQPAGEPTRDLLTLAREWVRPAVRAALQEALSENKPATVRDGLLETPQGRFRVQVTATPLESKTIHGHFLVSFEKREEPPPQEIPAATEDSSNEAVQLRSELLRMGEELQSTIEELQTSNEEMRAANEEAMSINEELQSTNEELETSKEELQSLNEELTTVNAQLQAKMEELEATTSDLSSLLSSTDIAVVFLNTRFQIRRFTPAIRDLIELIPADVGRPLSDLATKFTDPQLMYDCRAVLERLIPAEAEVVSTSNRVYMRRVLPYRTTDSRITGVVITFVEVTARKRAEVALRESEERLRLIIEGARDFAMILLDLDGKIASWNVGAERMFGYTEQEMVGKSGAVLFPQEGSGSQWAKEMAKAQDTGGAIEDCCHQRKNGETFWGSGVLSAIHSNGGTVSGFVKIIRDDTISRRQEAENQRAKSSG